MYTKICAKEIMTTKLFTLKPGDDIYTGLSLLVNQGISGAPVITEDGAFLGVFTEKSCMNVLIADQYHGPVSTHVEQFMYRNVMTISPDATVVEIGMIFLNNNVRRLPVIDGDKLVGQVSRRDVLRAVEAMRDSLHTPKRASNPIPYYSAVIDPLESKTEEPPA